MLLKFCKITMSVYDALEEYKNQVPKVVQVPPAAPIFIHASRLFRTYGVNIFIDYCPAQGFVI